MKPLTLLLLLAFFVSCGNRSVDEKLFTIFGGHNYLLPTQMSDSGFFALPIRDKVFGHDSFSLFYYSPILFKSFNEENISIHPLDKSVFRFVYFDGPLSSMKPILIRLTENAVVVKKGTKGSIEPSYDTSKLTSLEKFHYTIFQDYSFPYSNLTGYRKRYFDSIIKVYPALTDPYYYKSLLDKSSVLGNPFEYETTSKKISVSQYRYFLSLTNQSEFWTCSYMCDCKNMPMDAASFLLEANTPQKYQLVNRAICSNDTSRLIDACYELVRLAGLKDSLGGKIRWIIDYSKRATEIIIKEIEMDSAVHK